jgi:hypothetical protein
MTQGRTYLPILSTTTTGKGCSTSPDYGMVEPYVIRRQGPTRDVRIKPLFCIPTLAHIEIQ